ncbi:YfaZ family protein, partial [Klebsiella pneumoniae]|nr:YfaZ family protein [Klebsiella pneumoniae]
TLRRRREPKADYHYLNQGGKEGNRDTPFADGPYIGASASF